MNILSCCFILTISAQKQFLFASLCYSIVQISKCMLKINQPETQSIAAKAGPGQTQKPGLSLRSLLCVTGAQALGTSSTTFLRCVNSKLAWKWSSRNSFQYPHGVLASPVTILLAMSKCESRDQIHLRRKQLQSIHNFFCCFF